MQYRQLGKKSKRFSPGSDFMDSIFPGDLSEVDSAGMLRQGVIIDTILVSWKKNYSEHPQGKSNENLV